LSAIDSPPQASLTPVIRDGTTYRIDRERLHLGCNDLQPDAEIIILDSPGIRAKVMIAGRVYDSARLAVVCGKAEVEEKKMRRVLLFPVALTCLFFASSAFAQVGNTQMYFNGGYQGDVWSGGPEGSVATGFYDGSINGVNVGPGQTSPGFICDDYYDSISSGEHWSATGYQVSSLNASNIGQDTLFGNANWSNVTSGWTGVQGYQALAYLVNDMFTNGVGNSSLQSSISQALWYLTSLARGPGYEFSLSCLNTTAQNLVLYVENINNDPALSTYTGLYLYTQPFNPTGPQEMWGQIDVLMPEGGSAAVYLLICGVGCLGAVWQSRRQGSKASGHLS
jgi:hypothetical protein